LSSIYTHNVDFFTKADILPSSPAASVVSSTTPRRFLFATEVVTVDNSDDPHNAAFVPIYQTATFKQKGATASGEYDYSRSGNPTVSVSHCDSSEMDCF
jgi:cystathionine beta-lyase